MKPLLTLAALLVAIPVAADDPAPGGQTQPSAYYLRDDVQYFPAGPEFKLTNQVIVAAKPPAAADTDRYSLNLNAGINSKFGVHVAVGFEDKVRGIAVPPVTLPVTLIVRPRIEGLTAFANWLSEQD